MSYLEGEQPNHPWSRSVSWDIPTDSPSQDQEGLHDGSAQSLNDWGCPPTSQWPAWDSADLIPSIAPQGQRGPAADYDDVTAFGLTDSAEPEAAFDGLEFPLQQQQYDLPAQPQPLATYSLNQDMLPMREWIAADPLVMDCIPIPQDPASLTPFDYRFTDVDTQWQDGMQSDNDTYPFLNPTVSPLDLSPYEQLSQASFGQISSGPGFSYGEMFDPRFEVEADIQLGSPEETFQTPHKFPPRYHELEADGLLKSSGETLFADDRKVDATWLYCSNSSCNQSFLLKNMTGTVRGKVKAFGCSMSCAQTFARETKTNVRNVSRPCLKCPKPHVTFSHERVGKGKGWRACNNASRNAQRELERQQEQSAKSALEADSDQGVAVDL